VSEEEVFKKVLSTTIERFARQVMSYEIEIANLNAQLLFLSSAIEEAKNDIPAKSTPVNQKSS
jgi:hypothetical protein